MNLNIRSSLRVVLVCSTAMIATNAFAAGGGHGGGFGGGMAGAVGGIRGTAGGIDSTATRTGDSIGGKAVDKTIDHASTAADSAASVKATLPEGSVVLDSKTVMVPMRITGSRLPQMVPIHMLQESTSSAEAADSKAAVDLKAAVDPKARPDDVSIKSKDASVHVKTKDGRVAAKADSLSVKSKDASVHVKAKGDRVAVKADNVSVRNRDASVHVKTKGDRVAVKTKTHLLGRTSVVKVKANPTKDLKRVAGVAHSLTKTKPSLKSAEKTLAATTRTVDKTLSHDGVKVATRTSPAPAQ